MHAKAPYEEIIAGKLATLSLPGMADAIWARIEHQLDIDLPADDGDVPEPPPNPGGGMPVIVGSSFLLFIGALITYFYFQPGSKANAVTPDTSVQTKIQKNIPPSPGTSSNAKHPERNTAFYPPHGKPVTDMTPAPKTIFASNEDSVATPPELNTGTAITLPATTTPLPEVKKDSSVRKPRGVQGIQNNDYSIVPEKDSTR